MLNIVEKYEGVTEETLTRVEFKLLLRVGVLKEMSIDELKSSIRALFLEAGIPVRNRVDVSEDNLIRADRVFGEVLVAVRVGQQVNGVANIVNSLIKSSTLVHRLEIRGTQYFEVNDLRTIDEKYTRALYSMVVDIGDNAIEGIVNVKGKWRKDVLKFDGTVEDVKTDGDVLISGNRVDSEDNVYRLFIDVPHGVDPVRVVEKQFKIRKDKLKGYPVEVVHVYEEVDRRKAYVSRKRCAVTNDVVEMTVGGVICDNSIKAIMSGKI